MTKPTLLQSRFVATLNTPPASSCSAVPASMLLELNYATGGALPQPILDSNGDGVIDSADQYAGGNPAGLSIGRGYASSPTILTPPNGPLHKNITLSGGTTQSIINKNSAGRTASWWQVQ
jgi:type IV pilus assembly protein PilY1